MRICVDIELDAPAAVVWSYVADIPSHVEWMEDARSITFTSPTEFDCLTVVGPFRLRDRMEIVEWVEGAAIGIRHVGLVRGQGRFTLSPLPGGRTRFEWDEELSFPWWLGGPVGAFVARPILRRIWRRNLAGLASRFP